MQQVQDLPPLNVQNAPFARDAGLTISFKGAKIE
jgi:hypothetical protein